MASGTLNFSISLATYLAQAVSDGTNDDILVTPKIDDPTLGATPASQIDTNGGQLWSNRIDDMFLATYQGLYKAAKWWSVADAPAKLALGSDDVLAVNDLLFQISDKTLWYCTAVTGTATSTWSSIAALGDVTGPGASTDNAVTRFDGATGKLLQSSLMILDDVGNVSGIANLTLSGLVDGRDVAVDGAALDAHVADIANPHLSNLTKVLGAGSTTSGQDIELSVGDALIGNENATVPGGAPGAGKGTIWVKNDAPTSLQFTDDTGVDHDLSAAATGGDVVGPAGATDNAIARYDTATGKLIQNSAVTVDDGGNITTGGSILVTGTVDGRNVSADGTALDLHIADVANPHVTTLALALASGAVTGGTSITVSATDTVIFANTSTTFNDTTGTFIAATSDAQGIVIDTSGGAGPITLTPGGALELDYATFPAADGANTFVLQTDGAGALSWVANGGGGETLAATLALGNVTGGTDVIVSAGDALMLIENAAVPTAPAATQGVIWIKNDTPNTVWFTNDAGTDVQLGTAGAAETLAATLVAGATTGGTDLEVSVGDALLGNENATVPGGAPGAAKGTWWIKNDAPNTPYFTDDAGTDHNLLLPSGTAGGDLNGTYPNPSVDDGADATAIHDNVAGEIAAIANKVTPAAGDYLVIEDSAAGDIKKHILISSLPGSAGALSATLLVGNVTGGTDLEISSADSIISPAGAGAGAGGTLPIVAGVGGATGAGGPITIDGGDGGATSGTGGAVTITGGAAVGATGGGGAVSVIGGTARSTANGASVLFEGGTGGPTNGPGGTATFRGGVGGGNGAGGAVVVTGRAGTGTGAGGTCTVASGAGGTTNAGGNLAIQAGIGGLTSGAGGTVIIDGGDASNGNSLGGLVAITAGLSKGTNGGGAFSAAAGKGGATGTGGNTTIEGGAGGSTSGGGGALLLYAGDATSGLGGALSIVAGDGTSGGVCNWASGSGSAGAGGNFTITGGTGTTLSGNMTVGAGNGGGVNVAGGTALFRGGAAVSGSAAGGPSSVVAGAGVGTGTGGAGALTGGRGGTTGVGGAVNVTAGRGGATSGVGGAASVTGGAAAAGNTAGGDASFSGGAGFGTGTGGISQLLAGSGGASGDGGLARVRGGNGGATTGAGGTASMFGGNATTGNNVGGVAWVAGGTGIGNQVGGTTYLGGGNGGATGGGGDVGITSGNGGVTSGNSGNISITPGGVTSGTVGEIQMDTLKVRVDRMQHDYGTALVAGDFALHANWGTTASVSAITGTDSRFVITILPTGTGQGAAPTITLTYKDGAWPNAPFPMITDNGSFLASGAFINPCFELTSRTTTTAVWTLRNSISVAATPYTPTATDTFKMIVHVMG